LCPAALHFEQGGKSISKDLRVNQMIRAREVRLIDEENRQLGVIVLREALRIATEKGLDLVEVAPTASPVVCRIMDYGRYKYEQSKRDHEARKKQLVVDVKELKMGPNIEAHDFEVRVKNADRFLREGDKIKATIQFRGRQIQHSVLGRQVLARFGERLRDLAVVETEPRMEGRNMHIILAPRPEIMARARAGREGPAGPEEQGAEQPVEDLRQPADEIASAGGEPAPRPAAGDQATAPRAPAPQAPAAAPAAPAAPTPAAGGAPRAAPAAAPAPAARPPQRAPGALTAPRPAARPNGTGAAPIPGPAARPSAPAPAAVEPSAQRVSPR